MSYYQGDYSLNLLNILIVMCFVSIFKKLYFIKDGIIDSEKLPPIMPEKRLYVKLTFLSKDDTILKELAVHSGYLRIEKLSKAKLYTASVR